MDFMIPILIGLAAGGITLFKLFSELKTVVKNRAAADYVNAGSMKFSRRQDLFLYKQTDRTPIQRQTPPQQR